MIPSQSYKHLYEQHIHKAAWKVAGSVAAAVLLNTVVVLWFLLPAYNRHHDAARELASQRLALDALKQKPIVQQATDSGIAGIMKRLPPRLLLSELTTTIREAAAQREVLYVKLQQDDAAQQANSGTAAGASEQSGQTAQSSNGSPNEVKFRLTMYGDLRSLISFVTLLQHQEKLLIVDSIKYQKLEDTEGSTSLQLLAQLPSWRAGKIGYSLELTFRAFELPASVSSKFENISVAMN
ncbi:hypothetical protein [Paenibacillus kobensis]|uniref:hypothetical protein n=1 Tax=Paenibacillus kobensis TaxID=59841 RepID=UPI000FDAFA55|nr:hypothetical protein [Paenibacillus kobensis]